MREMLVMVMIVPSSGQVSSLPGSAMPPRLIQFERGISAAR
jgi:hypothetical protein